MEFQKLGYVGFIKRIWTIKKRKNTHVSDMLKAILHLNRVQKNSKITELSCLPASAGTRWRGEVDLFFTAQLYFCIHISSFLSSLHSAPACLSFPSCLITVQIHCALSAFDFKLLPGAFALIQRRAYRKSTLYFFLLMAHKPAWLMAAGTETISAASSLLLCHLSTDHILLGVVQSR